MDDIVGRETLKSIPTRIAVYLTLACYLAFAAALRLPALKYENGQIIDGFGCLLLGFVFWPSNFLFLLTPVMDLSAAVDSSGRLADFSICFRRYSSCTFFSVETTIRFISVLTSGLERIGELLSQCYLPAAVERRALGKRIGF
jgi:hypothetical protein